MYNSRPRSFKGGFAVPENYSGNAFSGEEESATLENVAETSETFGESIKEESVVEEPVTNEASASVEVGASPCKRSGIGFNVGRLFRGGIGFEELLIIALILLISQNDNNDDIIVLLALLLFIS